jgi:hypothetical protein
MEKTKRYTMLCIKTLLFAAPIVALDALAVHFLWAWFVTGATGLAAPTVLAAAGVLLLACILTGRGLSVPVYDVPPPPRVEDFTGENTGEVMYDSGSKAATEEMMAAVNKMYREAVSGYRLRFLAAYAARCATPLVATGVGCVLRLVGGL